MLQFGLVQKFVVWEWVKHSSARAFNLYCHVVKESNNGLFNKRLTRTLESSLVRIINLFRLFLLFSKPVYLRIVQKLVIISGWLLCSLNHCPGYVFYGNGHRGRRELGNGSQQGKYESLPWTFFDPVT